MLDDCTNYSLSDIYIVVYDCIDAGSVMHAVFRERNVGISAAASRWENDENGV
jgi:hypothetical protein